MIMRTVYYIVYVFIGVLLFAQAFPASDKNSIGPETKNICLLPMARGHCRALLSRWTYDVETGKCIEFKFGGCDGNGNNFASEKVCLDTCAGVQ